MYGVVLYLVSSLAVIISWKADRDRTREALRMAAKSFARTGPFMVEVAGLIGVLLALIPPQWISEYLGKQAGMAGTIGAALLGAITLIPGLIAFPLAGSLYQEGASTVTVAAFITTLTMVGVVTAPVEIQQLGKKMTLWRNGLSFVFALLIAVVMGVILG
ncbi:MAG: permease [Candidatus Fermentithermobacillus carboniphilus]|uniref:Permease n=1 Tax=Candidatus Fermentithermobacillus carboniphilus TaxID=3085328 RepID=A0AAT9LCF5_9FIRM|nr:MAG: permease [Candidatus Fermentithermobacillus carboniphilus]